MDSRTRQDKARQVKRGEGQDNTTTDEIISCCCLFVSSAPLLLLRTLTLPSTSNRPDEQQTSEAEVESDRGKSQ